jgi:hypothetical protein
MRAEQEIKKMLKEIEIGNRQTSVDASFNSGLETALRYVLGYRELNNILIKGAN